jgi:hypothetical protein
MSPAEIRAALARELEITGHHADVVDAAPVDARPASGAKAPTVTELQRAFPSTRALCQWIWSEFKVQLAPTADAYERALEIAQRAEQQPTPPPANEREHAREEARERERHRQARIPNDPDDRRPNKTERLKRFLSG